MISHILLISSFFLNADISDLKPYHNWYGVYLQGQKVGYQESILKKIKNANNQETLLSSQRLVAQVSGMGQNTKVEVLNEFEFDMQTKKLIRSKFKQSGNAGNTQINGSLVGQQFKYEMTTGGETQTIDSTKVNSIEDLLAPELLAVEKNAKVGDKKVISMYEVSIQKNLTIEYQIKKIEKRLFDGVLSQVRYIEAKTKELQFSSESVYNNFGQVLEAKTAQVFTIRLEDKEHAQDVSYVRDILVAFKVPVNKPIDNPYKTKNLDLELVGLNSFEIPQTPFQSVRKKDAQQARILINQHSFDKKRAALLPIHNLDVIKYLHKEPLIQSENQEIIKLAQSIVGSEKNSYVASQKILDWVYQHLTKAYVPAMSNALETLHNLKGDCGEHAVLFVALARAAKIPAQIVVGITYWPYVAGFGYHAWAKVYVGQWISVDPTQGTMNPDATHIELADGDLGKQAMITNLIGSLQAKIIH